MINKQSMWFLTLFGLVLVLGIYYITMPNDLLDNTEKVSVSDNTNASVLEQDILASLRVERDESSLNAMQALEDTLTSETATAEEKNTAFEELKILNLLKGKETSLEEKIFNEFNVKSFVKIEDNTVSVTISSDEHSTTLANKIMRSIQAEYDEKIIVTVKFE